MSTSTSIRPRKSAAVGRTRLIAAGAVLVVLILMFFGTKILTGADASKAAPGSFSPQSYAEEKYSSEIAPDIEKRAADLATVSKALKTDPPAAAKQYGVATGSSPAVYSVKFTGVAGKADANGFTPVKVAGVPDDIKVLVQMGPALTGTAIRDATGKVDFAQFKNQIDYQNVGAELNNQVKKTVLANVDATAIGGKNVSVVGAFQLINPAAYIITPVKVEITK